MDSRMFKHCERSGTVEDCLFCKIVQGAVPSKKVLETETVYAFHDIDPKAPVHILLIPKKHIRSAQTLSHDDASVVGDIHLAAQEAAQAAGIAEDGYRIVTNVGDHGHQTVHHLHYHLLGGRQMLWPPG